ncbi:hypothetical protein SK128_006469 [Halocaridina rubra]|uniref:Uncharacterized protein n=1 Tax=Halocaridina rubra TaxID=373956 RepID=A0AAN8XD53_HALRR
MLNLDYDGDPGLEWPSLRILHSYRMRLTTRHQLLAVTLLSVALSRSVYGAPIPSPDVSEEENVVEVYEDGLLILVPSISASEVGKEMSGQDLKREIKYEVVAISGETLRREIREIAQSYGAPSALGGTPLVLATDDIQDFGEVIIPAPPSGSYNQPSGGGVSLGGGSFAVNPPTVSVSLPTVSISSAPTSFPTHDLGAVLTNVAGHTNNFVQGAGDTLTQVGIAGSQVLGQVGSAAATNGVELASWLLDQKTRGIGTATQVIGGGLQYAGRLSASVLRALLQIPGIKARVLSEVIEASQPLVYAVSDVIAENADDLGDLFAAKTSIVQDAVAIIIRLIQDTLALKGRIIVSLGSNGLDFGATAFNAGVKIGGAFIESASKVATALGSGVGDLVRVATTVDLPPAPALPPLEIPRLPDLTIPSISVPSVDLTKLIPSAPVLDPIPLPAKPASSLPTITVSSGSAALSSPSFSVSSGGSPSQTYGYPGR